jgi:hypothetical protein
MATDNEYVRGAARLSRRIETIRARYTLPPLVAEIGALLLKRTRERFARELTPDYTPWAALKPATLRRKAAEGFGDEQKLVRRGKLRDSIQVIAGGVGSTFFNTGAGIRIGIADPEVADYARRLNNGTPGRMTARRFLGIGALDVRSVDSFLRRKAAQLEAGL